MLDSRRYFYLTLEEQNMMYKQPEQKLNKFCTLLNKLYMFWFVNLKYNQFDKRYISHLISIKYMMSRI